MNSLNSFLLIFLKGRKKNGKKQNKEIIQSNRIKKEKKVRLGGRIQLLSKIPWFKVTVRKFGDLITVQQWILAIISF